MQEAVERILIEYFKEYLQKELKGDFDIYSYDESKPAVLSGIASAGYGIIINYGPRRLQASSVCFGTDIIYNYGHSETRKSMRKTALGISRCVWGHDIPFDFYSEKSLHNTAELVAKYTQEDIDKCQHKVAQV